MVVSKRIRLKIEIDIDIPADLIEDKNRLKLIEDGIIKSISKGLYEEGISFHIKKIHFDIWIMTLSNIINMLVILHISLNVNRINLSLINT